jgi:hypothetical protein
MHAFSVKPGNTWLDALNLLSGLILYCGNEPFS